MTYTLLLLLVSLKQIIERMKLVFSFFYSSSSSFTSPFSNLIWGRLYPPSSYPSCISSYQMPPPFSIPILSNLPQPHRSALLIVQAYRSFLSFRSSFVLIVQYCLSFSITYRSGLSFFTFFSFVLIVQATICNYSTSRNGLRWT